MPMGPKWPLKTASRRLLTSGIHLYSAIIAGSLRSTSTRIAITTSRQTESDSSGLSNCVNGVHAPTNTNAATLNSKSITDENTACSVCLLKKPSHANAVPHEKAARRSSEPSIVVVPMVSSASETYCAT